MDPSNILTDRSSNITNRSRASERFDIEREKALETVRKFDQLQRTVSAISNKENELQGISLFEKDTSFTEASDFQVHHYPNSINISDLVTDESIELEKSSFKESTRTGTDIEGQDLQELFFDPNEITARSTQNQFVKKKAPSLSEISVADILASSFAPQARDLGESLRCMNESHFSQSLLGLAGGEGFSFTSARQEQSECDSGNFLPAEMIGDKLILDEIAWADEYAAIPSAMLSKQARAQSNISNSSRNASWILRETDSSMDDFFKKRSENLWDMIQAKSPVKMSTPRALLDLFPETMCSFQATSTSFLTMTAVDPELTPKPDNNTYTVHKKPLRDVTGTRMLGENTNSIREHCPTEYEFPKRRLFSGNLQRSTTTKSTSSEFSHHSGKSIPLKVTTFQLSWGSTKLRTTVSKTMQVKNFASKRLTVRLVVEGPGFQLTQSQSNLLSLQAQECRSITLSLCPTVTGIARGSLCFYSPTGNVTTSAPFLKISLYAFGGHAEIVPQNILKGPVGSPFLPLGDVCELTEPLQRTFQIYNRGPLLGFAQISIDSMSLLMPRLSDAFEVKPQCMLISAGESVTVTVSLRPTRSDIKKIVKKIKEVLTLANLRIIYGDEPNRQRMRHLWRQLSQEERSKFPNNLEKLWIKFPQEVSVGSFETFKEEPDVLLDLMACCKIQEIALTINRDSLDETLLQSTSMHAGDADETVLFKTIWEESPRVDDGEEF